MSDALVVILALLLAGAAGLLWRERGQTGALRLDLDRLRESKVTTDDHERILAALQATINDQKRALETLRDALAAREQATAAVQAEADARLGRLRELDAACAALESALSGARNALTQRDAEEANRAARDEERETARALARTLADNAYDALLVMDSERRVLALNERATALFHHPQPIGAPLTDVTRSPEIDAVVQDALTYEEDSYEEQATLDRRVYRVHARVSQSPAGMVVALALMDITDLVRLNRARRDMVANISHELRTPIANIRVIIDSIFHEQEKPKGKASRSALKAIARETDSLLWLVQELLDLSMIESGQAILRMVDVPAALLVAEAAERMMEQSEAKDLAIVTDVPVDVEVLCDRDQARRVLINLIHNAIKWSPPGETITVRVRPDGDEVVFAVLDNGPGVPDDLRERIFERFYQVDPSRSGGEGTGLGLAISKHIVEAHGGRIWAEGSSAGGGGRFLFTLPSATERVEAGSRSERA